MIKSGLNQEKLDKKTYWFPSHPETTIPDAPSALLLSIYDEYTIAYNDRSDISDARDIERMIVMGNALTAVIVLNGKVAGTWKRAMKRDSVEISRVLSGSWIMTSRKLWKERLPVREVFRNARGDR